MQDFIRAGDCYHRDRGLVHAMSKFFIQVQSSFEKRPVLFSILLITGLLLIFYSNSFTADWHYDDFHHIKENINIRKITNIPKFFKDPTTFSRNPQTRMYRPLLMVTHAINYQLGLMTSRNGYNVIGYHVFNFLFHLVNTLAIFFIIKYLFTRKIHVEGIHPALPAVFAAVLFGLHTINTETIVYISSRSSAMSTTFVLLSFLLYLKAVDKDRISIPLLLASAFSFFCGLLSKEIAITLPAMILYYEIFLNRGWMNREKHLKAITGLGLRLLPHTVTALGFLLLRDRIIHDNLVKVITSKGGTPAAPNLTSQLATQSRAWVYYMKEMLWPTGLSIDKPFKVSRTFSEPTVVLSLIIILAIVTVAVLLRKKHPVIIFSTLWFFTALLPTSVVRLNIVINDHRLYLPGFGFVLAAAYIGANLLKRFRSQPGRRTMYFAALCVAIILLMGIGTYRRNAAFATEETMWKDVILKDKKSVRGYNNLGIYYEQKGQFDKAIRYYSKTVQLAPMFPNPYINLGNVYHKKKEYYKAEKFMRKALSLNPRSALASYNLGNILRQAGKIQEAIGAYKRALQLNPRYIESANNLANIYFKAKKYPEAIQYYKQALFIDPTFAMSYYNIGLAQAQLGRSAKAIQAFEKFAYYWQGDKKYVALARRSIEQLKKTGIR